MPQVEDDPEEVAKASHDDASELKSVVSLLRALGSPVNQVAVKHHGGNIVVYALTIHEPSPEFDPVKTESRLRYLLREHGINRFDHVKFIQHGDGLVCELGLLRRPGR